jgi:hypothetical protein
MLLNFVIRFHKENDIFISIAVLFLPENFKKINKVIDAIKGKEHPRTFRESLEGK